MVRHYRILQAMGTKPFSSLTSLRNSHFHDYVNTCDSTYNLMWKSVSSPTGFPPTHPLEFFQCQYFSTKDQENKLQDPIIK